MTKRIVIGALLALAACTRPAVRLKHWRQDLATLASEISTHHPGAFAHVAEKDWRKAIDDLDAHVSIFDDAHIEVGMLHVVAMIGDSHTRLYMPRESAYPVRFLWFDDGVFVAGADAANAWAIGKRVVAIGNRKIDDALATLASLVPTENDAGMRNEVPPLMSDPVAMVGTDLVLGDTATFVLADGPADAAGPSGSVTRGGAGTKDLNVSPGHAVALAPPKVLPLHMQGPTDRAYWNKYVDDQRLLYFQYNVCADDPHGKPFAQFAADTLAFADQHPVDRFVIDLRSNTGGDSRVIEPLIEGIAARPALVGRVFVLIGRTTFSSAMLNAIELKEKLGATLVGTPTGGNPNGWGEVKQFELPNSHFAGQYSTKLFKSDRYPGNTVTPDVPVHVTSDDWFSGRDPAMDAVLAASVPTAHT